MNETGAHVEQVAAYLQLGSCRCTLYYFHRETLPQLSVDGTFESHMLLLYISSEGDVYCLLVFLLCTVLHSFDLQEERK